jgi:hypothetical protein
MIHIDYPNGQKPPEDWLKRATGLTDQLKQTPDKESRDRIIDANQKLWGEIKDWLGTFSHQKCWFSEALDTCSYWQVEHFRPKKEVKDPDRDGYWWLAFDYLNYRLCGSVVNTKKGCHFPLRPGSVPAMGPQDNCDDEARVLIDPIRKADVDLITFSDGGKAVPLEPDGWNHERALKSIERYKLNGHVPLRRGRATVWNRCRVLTDELQVLLAEDRWSGKHSATRQEKIEKLKCDIKAMTLPNAPFSAVARAFLLQDSRRWARQCLG